MSLPDPPINVKLELHDGTIMAVETVYVGVQEGTHTWQIVNGPPTDQVKAMTIDKLPPRSSVMLTEGFIG